MLPKVTIITVNYNSEKVMDIVRESIQGILRLRYKPFEIMMVDNDSTDNSLDYLISMIKNIPHEDVDAKLVKLQKNVGFTGGNNSGFEKRDKQSKYIALMNIDLIPEPNSLTSLVEYMEEHRNVAGVQGKILTWDGQRIDNTGFLVGPFGYVFAKDFLMPPSMSKEESVVTVVEACYAVYRVDAIIRAGGLFETELFMYSEDHELALRLWRAGYELRYVPVTAGRHYGSALVRKDQASKGSQLQAYCGSRSRMAVLIMYSKFWFFEMVVVVFQVIMQVAFSRELRHNFAIRGTFDGISLGIRLRKKVKLIHSLEPKVVMNPIQLWLSMLKIALIYGRSPQAAQYHRNQLLIRLKRKGFRPS